jgi:hypothetical protein
VEEWILQDQYTLSHMEATLGILAFGSLISNPGAEIEAALVGRKVDVRTPFGVEFARGSTKRGGALCLTSKALQYLRKFSWCFRTGGQG